MLAANPTFHRAGSQLSPPFETCRNSTEVQRGWGDLIPHEEKWKLINHSTYLFRGGGGFDPLWREVEVNKPFNILVQRRWGIWPLSREVEVNKLFNIFVQRGWGDLIPHEEKWKLIDHSTYLFRGGGWSLMNIRFPSRMRPCWTQGCLSRISGLFESSRISPYLCRQ